MVLQLYRFLQAVEIKAAKEVRVEVVLEAVEVRVSRI